MVRLIFGLGNPGGKYENTRHNAGFMALNRLAAKHGFDRPVGFGRSFISKGSIGSHKVILGWPQTYMNLSGEAVLELAQFYKTTGSDILVLHDDLDLNPGRIKLSYGGGAAGHKGLISIMGLLPDEFCRLKIGIGRPPKEIFVNGNIDFVLGRFVEPEWPMIDQGLEEAACAATDWVSEGLVKTRDRVNRKKNESPDQPA